MALKILLNGARGRMGLAIADAAKKEGVEVAAATDMGDNVRSVIELADVVVDFSSPSATRGLIEAAVAAEKPLVIGTTGHTPGQKAELLALASQVPCIWAGNFSIGVNLLFALTRRATRLLGDDYDAEVIEMHHRLKKDAPSGTAERLLQIILEERKLDHTSLRHGRQGLPGERTKSEVGIHAIRGGDVVGDHTVIFAGAGERIELTHRASDRTVFSNGALRAAHWIVSRKAGLYDMQDVLGLA
jgi:4-hydroxy-tetrahydrodipicolinate reductase